VEVYKAMCTTFAAMISGGKTVKQLTKVNRNRVENFIRADTVKGTQFDG
jgi:hypothetical protein